MATTNYDMASALARKNPELSKALQQLVVKATKVIKALDNPYKRSLFGVGENKLEAAQEQLIEKLIEAATYTNHWNAHGNVCADVLDELTKNIKYMEQAYPNWKGEYEMIHNVIGNLRKNFSAG